MGENRNWVERLEEEFQWSDSEPGPERVVEEARKRGIDSVEFLIDRMEEANEVSNTISKIIEERLPEDQTEGVLDNLSGGSTTGYMRWKWYIKFQDSFVRNPSDKE